MKKLTTRIDEENILPSWFTQWYFLLEQLKSELLCDLDDLLTNNDPFWAVEFFEKETAYNEKKVWH